MRNQILGAAIMLFALTILSCETEQKNTSETTQTKVEVAPEEPKRVLPAILAKGMRAHDPKDQWADMQTLRFSLESGGNKQTHLVDLPTRKIRIESDKWTMGNNGKDVWVAPSKEAYGKGSARFFHSVYFYFVAMPFVLTDPGINYKVVPPKKFADKMYDGVSITYQSNVGDAPDDEYIAYFDQETHMLSWLLYTVTYGKDGPSTRYGCRQYADWQKVNDVWLPQTMIRYKYEDDALGEKGSEQKIFEMALTDKKLAELTFNRPDVSEIDAIE